MKLHCFLFLYHMITSNQIIGCYLHEQCPWDKARCNKGVCDNCNKAGQCERFDGLQHCDRYWSGECVTCVGRNSSYCESISLETAPADLCDETSGKCVACLTDSDCLNDVEPNCNPANGKCYKCYDDDHCPDPTAIQCVDNECISCDTDSHCPGNTTMCDEGICVTSQPTQTPTTEPTTTEPTNTPTKTTTEPTNTPTKTTTEPTNTPIETTDAVISVTTYTDSASGAALFNVMFVIEFVMLLTAFYVFF
eukprot:280570_1